MTIQLHNLTPEQIALLDKIWAIDELEDFARFCSRLPREKRQMVETLTRMMDEEYLEVDIQALSSYPIAEAWLSSIGVTLERN